MRTQGLPIVAALMLGIAVWVLPGCSAVPLDPAGIEDAGLAAIYSAYENSVAVAHADSQQQWTSGWLGNMWVNFWGADNRGLCYEWKNYVYHSVAPTVARVGWQATGIVVNEGTAHEHHGVLVFDPERIDGDRILQPPVAAGAFVLDPWRTGAPDMYALSDWLHMAQPAQVPARLKPVAEAADPAPRAAAPQ